MNIGYKSAILRNGKLYSPSAPDFEISKARVGSVVRLKKFYLGTTEEFVIDLYSGLSDEPEVLLTYEYKDSDVVSGGPPDHPYSEIVVKRARLLVIEPITTYSSWNIEEWMLKNEN